jgi:putative flippase GtrA
MIKKCLRIYKKNEEIINYLIIGFLTTVISLIAYYICVHTFLNPDNGFELQIANIISWIVGVSFAYITNRIIVFKSKEKNILKECISFVGSRIVTLLLDMFIMFLFVTVFRIDDLIAKIISQIVVIIGNYIISKLFVFKKKKEQ